MFNTQNIKFTQEEFNRYSRQIALPGIGMEGQKKLKNARVAVVGAGGLGAPLLQYLAVAGVGNIGIFDFDRVETSNLQRQVLYHQGDVGKSKAQTAKNRIQKLNPHITIEIHNKKISASNVVSLLKNYDVIADGSDNFLTRYVVNDASLISDIPLVYGSIYQFEGQVSVFNYVDDEGNRGPNYRDLFPEIPEQGFIPNCAEAGVMGALPGIIGSIQAMEVIKIITGIGDVLSGSMLVLDSLTMEFQKITIPVTAKKQEVDTELVKNRLNSISKMYSQNGSDVTGDMEKSIIPQLTPRELHALQQENEPLTLIDLRTSSEHHSYNIGGKLIPLNQLTEHLSKIPDNGKIVFYCESGIRSTKAVEILQNKFGYENLYNLEGGLAAWRAWENQHLLV